MKHFLFIFVLLLSISCQNTPKKKAVQEPLPISEMITTEDETILMGKINRANLLATSYTQWFKEEYDFYRVPEDWTTDLKNNMDGVTLKLFMGTWCEDTQRELGGMYRLLDALDFDDNTLEMFALSEYKESPEGIEKEYNITNIPTLIFYKNGVEMNRFVELPVETLAIDLKKILLGEPYQNAYYQE